MIKEIDRKISRNSAWLKWNEEAKKRKLTSTLELTLNLFLEGKSIEEIIEIRKFKEDSIYRQIVDLITMGFIHVDDVVGEEKRRKIIGVITEENISSLKLIKEEVGEEISYFEIKCVLAHENLEPAKRGA